MSPMFMIYGMLFAILYFILAKSQPTTIALLILFSLWAYYLVIISAAGSKERTASVTLTRVLDDEIENRRKQTKVIVSDQYANTILSKKQLRYLKHNKALLDVAWNLLFIRMFDPSRYQDLLWHLNTLQKTYMYILLKRFPIASHMPMFEDTRKSIVEILHSMILIVPLTLKHTFGLEPMKEVEKSIKAFISVSNTMFDTLRNFAVQEENVSHLPVVIPYPSNFLNHKNALP